MSRALNIVGIDLGTTHTVVAHHAAGDGTTVFPIPQLVAEGTVAAEPLLPSVLFAPPAGEAAPDAWDDAPWVIGVHARARGQRLPSRCITSAKSWLCHGGVDRLAAILPWGGDSGDTTLPRLSPVEASRRILQHVQRAYDAAFPSGPLAAQTVVLTVPASFDEVARELTVRAATEAGLHVRLLEEPLAAFYDYLARHGTGELASLANEGSGAHVLVCDVGGGTTDLTLIRAQPASAATKFGTPGGERKDVQLDRVAVGRHLLLGGDNMDLALAHALEPRLVAPPERLPPALFSELTLACRSAKERLLAKEAPESEPVRVLSRGSALVGSTLSATLERSLVHSLVLDGFFPVVERDAGPVRARTALVAFGLPYEHDAAITRHLAEFVRRHLPVGSTIDAVLLNGGVFRSPLVRDRLLTALERLAGTRPRELAAPDPDLAVARGAVAFGLSLLGETPRVGAGSARGYYVGLASRDHGERADAAKDSRRAICVVPRGAAEGERHVVAVPGLSLVVGQAVRFDLYSTDVAEDAPGAIVPIDASLDALPSMTTAFETTSASTSGPTSKVAGARSAPPAESVPVQLEGELTAIGTLDVACVEHSKVPIGSEPRRFRLAFDLRGKPERSSTRPPPSMGSSFSTRPPPSARQSDAKLDAARELLDKVFGKGRADADPRDARQLMRELERLLGERATWTTETSRALFDAFVGEAKARRRSEDHERAFWMLAGFCLRPGYGFPLDGKRVGKLVPLFTELLAFPEEARGWQQLFIAWRRVAGGLGEAAQTGLRDLIDPFLSTDEVKPKKRKGMKPLADSEMLELAASLEAVPQMRRADLGRWLLERTWSSRDPRLWAALGRVGARVPTYASAHHVVPPATVERWLDHLLREKWNEMPSAARAALEMARVTGDRSRDVSETTRAEIAKRLEAVNADAAWIRAVLSFVPIEDADRTAFFGESLPVGLVLSS